MVGIPRSRGCLLCIRRRVRCDEGRPGCQKCATYGADCPGYNRSPKFVAEKHQVRRKAGEGRQGGKSRGSQNAHPQEAASTGEASFQIMTFGPGGFGAPHPTRTKTSQQQTSSGPEGATGQAERGDAFPSSDTAASSSSGGAAIQFVEETPQHGHGTGGQARLSEAWPGSGDASVPAQIRLSPATHICAMVDQLHLRRHHPSDLLYLGPWFYRIPDQLGNKVTLDSAMGSFVMHLLGKSLGSDDLISGSRQLYGRSLGALQAALNHPVEWRSSETLCTSMILCMYELFADTSGSSSSWLQHSQGVSKLMKMRGTGGYKSHWDRAMLFSFRNIIIMASILSGQDCFLAKKKWQRVLANVSEFGKPIQTGPGSGLTTGNFFTKDAIHQLDRLIGLFAFVPGIMRHAFAIRYTRMRGLPVDGAMVALLRRGAARVHTSLADWYQESKTLFGDRDPIYTEVPSCPETNEPPSPYATVLTYPNGLVGSVFLMYATTMLLVQECLNQCAAVRAEADIARHARESMRQSGTSESASTHATAVTAATTASGPGGGSAGTEGAALNVDIATAIGGFVAQQQTPSAALAEDLADDEDGYDDEEHASDARCQHPSPTSLAAAAADLPTIAPRLAPKDNTPPPSFYNRSYLPFEQANRELCNVILRSFENVGRGFMGMYRIGFSMRIVYEFADVPTQLWIRRRLEMSAEDFGTARVEAYPAAHANEYSYN